MPRWVTFLRYFIPSSWARRRPQANRHASAEAVICCGPDGLPASATVPIGPSSDAVSPGAEQEEEWSSKEPLGYGVTSSDRSKQSNAQSASSLASQDTSTSRNMMHTPLFSLIGAENVAAQEPVREGAVKAWHELRNSRNTLLQLRIDAQEKRLELKVQRDQLLATLTTMLDELKHVEDDIMINVRHHVTGELESLAHRWKDLQPVEQELENLDADIIMKESQMTEIEGRFYASSLPLEIPHPYHEMLSYHKPESSASSSHIRADNSPAALHFLALLGDMDLLREQIDEVKAERLQLEEDHTLRLRLNVEIHPDSLQALQLYDEDLKDLSRQFHQKQEDLSAIAMQMPSRDKDTPEIDSKKNSQESPPLDPDEEEYFRALSSNQLDKHQIQPSEEANERLSAKDRIETWLLASLCQSSMQRRIYLDISARESPTIIANGLGLRIIQTWYAHSHTPADSFDKGSSQQESDRLAGLFSRGSGEATADSSSLERSSSYHISTRN